VPVLLLTGDRDAVVPPATSTAAAARIPRARVASLGPLGHLAHEEAADIVQRAIMDQLNK